MGNAPAEGRLGQYQAFFQPLIDELRNQHNFTAARKALPQSWYSFAAGVTGITYSVTFPVEKTLRCEVYISTGRQELNKAIYDILFGRKDELEKKVGMELVWDRGGDKRFCRISTSIPGSIDEPAARLAEMRTWAIGTLLQLKVAFAAVLQAAAQEARSQLSSV